jgi:hypothetical protein
MSYFNHAFQKCFLGTGATRDLASTGAAESPTNPYSTGGFITTSGSPSLELANIGAGYFGFYDKDTYLSVAEGDLNPGECCPLVLAAASLKLNDKQGPFHGGYKESNKSKYINPKLIRQFYRVNDCVPQQNIVHVGNTNYTGTSVDGVASFDVGTLVGGTGYTDPGATGVATTAAPPGGTGLLVDYVTDGAGVITSITINNPGSGYSVGDVITVAAGNNDATIEVLAVDGAVVVDAACAIPFYCDETYYLRVEVKGSPALRFANHNLYQTLQADGGCCDGPVPTEVDSTLIYIQWAQGIVENPFFAQFIQPIVFDELGNPWFQDAATAVSYGSAPTQIWDNYVSTGHIPGASGGMRLLGAYVDTTFGNCTFMVTDHYEKEPIRILASLVDYNGDPCVFEGVCVIEECPALQGMGFGEQVARDLIMHESYLQNFFATDLRVREITQGTNILDSVDRASLYTRYFIQHTVPRFNNPSGTFDNDQYLLDVIVPGAAPAGPYGNAAFESFMNTWLTNCGDECTSLVVRDCTPCVPTPVPVV